MKNKEGYLRDLYLAAEWLFFSTDTDRERDTLEYDLAVDYEIDRCMVSEHMDCAIARMEGHSDNPRENGY